MKSEREEIVETIETLYLTSHKDKRHKDKRHKDKRHKDLPYSLNMGKGRYAHRYAHLLQDIEAYQFFIIYLSIFIMGSRCYLCRCRYLSLSLWVRERELDPWL